MFFQLQQNYWRKNVNQKLNLVGDNYFLPLISVWVNFFPFTPPFVANSKSKVNDSMWGGGVLTFETQILKFFLIQVNTGNEIIV